MPKVIVFIGVPGAGKSTVAQSYVADGYVQVERDQIREDLMDAHPGIQKDKDAFEKEVSRIHSQKLISAIKAGKDVVVSDTNINPKTREKIQNICGSLHAEYVEELIGHELLFDELQKRNSGRHPSKVVPLHVMNNFYARFREQYPIIIGSETAELMEKRPECNRGKSLAVIFDIDGTVAHMGNRRGPFDWAKVDLDEPDYSVISIIQVLAEQYDVLAVSGRDSVCREITEKWIEKFMGLQCGLIMRPSGSYMKDSAVKHDLFWEHIYPHYNVVAVLDDRKQVVDMWRSIGLKCMQVQEGDF